jgi:phenylacetate-CoA ligase
VAVARIKDTIGLTTHVVVEPPGTVERSVGKARRVLDRRPKG